MDTETTAVNVKCACRTQEGEEQLTVGEEKAEE